MVSVPALLPSQEVSYTPGHESEAPREQSHVDPLEEWPPPGICLPAHDGHRTDALKCKNIKNHQRDSQQGSVHG